MKKIEEQLEETTKERDRLKVETDQKMRSTVSDIKEITTTLSTVESGLELKSSELENARAEIDSLNKELDAAKQEINKVQRMKLSHFGCSPYDLFFFFSELAVESEARYSQEVVLHSKAIQALDAAQKQLKILSETEGKLRQERDDAVSTLAAKTSFWDEQQKRYDDEVNSLNTRMKDLDEQNRLLHDTLQKLNNELTVLQAKVSGIADTSDVETSLNTSSELSNKAQEQLMKVVKFLRQEKDIAITQSELLQAESTRLRAQVSLLQRQVEEANSNLKTLKETSDVTEKTSAKHAELARKIETLNAVTDSNRLLREERNRFKSQAAELSEKLKLSEESVATLQSDIRELVKKIDSLTDENQILKAEVSRWKSRSAQMAERAKASPEDWRRLNNERENLAKQWQAEKNNNEKLEETIKTVRAEHCQLTEHINDLRKKLLTETSEVCQFVGLFFNYVLFCAVLGSPTQ